MSWNGEPELFFPLLCKPQNGVGRDLAQTTGAGVGAIVEQMAEGGGILETLRVRMVFDG